jgi:hypothetical protein
MKRRVRHKLPPMGGKYLDRCIIVCIPWLRLFRVLSNALYQYQLFYCSVPEQRVTHVYFEEMIFCICVFTDL